jgi:hypothetical protein
VEFFVGLHQPSDARHFSACCINIKRLLGRVRPLYEGQPVKGKVIVDSGAFMQILKHGGYPESVEAYAEQIRRVLPLAEVVAVVAQDYMCEPHMLARTGLTVADHQWLTIERYDSLLWCQLPTYVMPALQGYEPAEYVSHIRQYGARLKPGMWVGVGSVCKRNTKPEQISRVLQAIKAERPDLLLHGFGVKLTALRNSAIVELLHSADSLAWSYAARRQGRNANSWREAERFCGAIERGRPGIP